MTKHPYETRSSSPAVQRAREKLSSTSPAISRVTRDVSAPGGVRVDLDVKVADLEEVGIDLDEKLPTAWVSDMLDDGKNPRWMGAGEATLKLHLETEASFVRVKGQGRFALSHPCVRCLSDIPFDVTLELDLRLVEKVDGPIEGAWGEGDADGDDFEGPALGDASDLEDLSIASYQDGVVKVRDLLREQLFLELPMHPACDSRDARPERECAFDENSANAGERAGWTTSRWASLAALRDKLPPGPKTAPAEVKKMTRENNGVPKAAAADAAKPAKGIHQQKGDAFYARDTQVMRNITDDDVVEEAIELPGKQTAALQGKAPPPVPHDADDGVDDDDGEVTAPLTPGAMRKPPASKAKAPAKAKPVAKKAKPAAKKAKKAKPAAKKAKPAPKKAKAKKAPAKKAKAKATKAKSKAKAKAKKAPARKKSASKRR